MSQDVERDSIPGDAEIVRAYNALPKTSPLLRYFVQATAFNRTPYMENKAELDDPMDLPAAFTQQVMTLALNRAAAPDKYIKPDYVENPCLYHEHDDRNEEKACRSAHNAKQLLERLRRQAHRKYRKGKSRIIALIVCR